MLAKLYRKELMGSTQFTKVYSIRPVQKVRKFVVVLDSLKLGIDLGDCAPSIKVLSQSKSHET
jgi:hypothetical protein